MCRHKPFFRRKQDSQTPNQHCRLAHKRRVMKRLCNRVESAVKVKNTFFFRYFCVARISTRAELISSVHKHACEWKDAIHMVEIKGMVSKKAEYEFRRLAMKKLGYRKGSLSQALEEAVYAWIKKCEKEL
jgi:hypothetical protein